MSAPHLRLAGTEAPTPSGFHWDAFSTRGGSLWGWMLYEDENVVLIGENDTDPSPLLAKICAALNGPDQ